jgi:1-deoxy-D-xylulose-5-phosphate synthase
LDTTLIGDVAKRVRYVVTVEEGARMGGFGSAVLEALSELGLTHLRTKVLGLPDWYIEQGPQDLLRERYGLTSDGIFESVKALVAQEVTGTVSASPAGPLAGAGGTKKRESLGDEQGS